VIHGLRDWSGHSTQEVNLIGLQRSIQSEGQLEPGVVRETEEGYVLVSGERRLRAVQAARAEGENDLLFRAIVEEMDADQAIRVALHENVHRDNFSAIEFARNVKFARSKFGWPGKTGTNKVAEYLEVSPATVTQAERLLALPDEIQARLAAGEISTFTALEFANVKPEKVDEVAAEAVEIAGEEAKTKAKTKKEKALPLSPGLLELKKKHKERVQAQKEAQGEGEGEERPLTGDGEETNEPSPVSASATKPPPPAKVTAKHVRAAAKKLDAQAKTLAPKLGEVIEKFESWSGPAYPKVMSKFAGGVADWAHGKMKEKVFDALWEDLADAVSRPATGKLKTAKVKKPAKAKTETKPKAKAKPKTKAKGKK